jgi:AcrR family transcriptional regulator
MKEQTATRPYRQRRRAAAAEANTERILQAALDLFVERPWDQITLAGVAERAGVGLQTVIRRFGTKDGLSRAVTEWTAPQILETRGEPDGADPAAVAAALARQYESWGASTDRVLRQEDVSPSLTEAAAAGRAAHREWVERVFAPQLAALPKTSRADRRARLIAVCGVELWLVLRRDGALSVDAATAAVADLITASLAPSPSTPSPESP